MVETQVNSAGPFSNFAETDSLVRCNKVWEYCSKVWEWFQ